MFSYFNTLKSSRKSQVFPLLIAVMVILIIAALISANLGKVSMDRLNTMNAADAGALAGVSDFTCAYNRGWIFNTIIIGVYVAVQIYLAWPQIFACIASREGVAMIARNVNNQVYLGWREMVRNYSASARKDAFYYAFINAGIDDKFKWDSAENSYRNRPHPGESWSRWSSLKSAFNKWLDDLPPNWDWPYYDADARCYLGYAVYTSSLTYDWSVSNNWNDKSKSLTVTVTSTNADTSHRKLPLIGIYYVPTPFGPVFFPWYHGRPYAMLLSPDLRYVRVRVQRHNRDQQKDLGFWTVRQPDTVAEAYAEMTGSSVWGGNNFRLRRIR